MTTENTTGNIFSGLKVVDFASFIAGPSAAVILSDFGADVVKVEPPKGEMWRIGQKIPPQPNSDVPYPFQLANRNKRSLALILNRRRQGKFSNDWSSGRTCSSLTRRIQRARSLN